MILSLITQDLEMTVFGEHGAPEEMGVLAGEERTQTRILFNYAKGPKPQRSRITVVTD